MLLGALVLSLPASSAPRGRTIVGDGLLAHVSQVVTARFWAANPDLAPPQIADGLHAVTEAGTKGRHAGKDAPSAAFNADDLGLPQNEESVSACRDDPKIVLMGTNDYRGLVDPEGNFTGWHLSVDGGRSLANEGLLPPVPLLSDPGAVVSSGGDPVDVVGGECALYAASLAYDPFDPFGTNGIAVYKSDPETLVSCPGGPDPGCWPTAVLVAEGTGIPDPTPDSPSHFLDKPWMDVGVSGDEGEVVWVTWTDVAITGPGELDFTAEIFAARCDTDLASCSAPIPISEDDVDVQFSDVTIALDGRVYVTWAQIEGELTGGPPVFIIKMRVAEPGETVFGPERIVFVEDRPIPFGGFLHANDFRVATYPKNDVAMVDGNPRAFVVWDACRFLPLDTFCEEAEIRLVHSDDFGATWSEPVVLSAGGDNYFPSIASNDDEEYPALAFTWFTNRFDETFHNRQDVEFLTMDPASLETRDRQRLTSSSNESEADPILGGFFIGDYIEVFATGERAYVGYNANYLHEQLLGPFGVEGIPVPQQDNFLVRLRIGDGTSSNAGD